MSIQGLISGRCRGYVHDFWVKFHLSLHSFSGLFSLKFQDYFDLLFLVELDWGGQNECKLR
jgi:hypothetical protein